MFRKFHTSNENRFCDFYHKLSGILFNNSYFKQVLIDLGYYSDIHFTISLRQVYDSFYYVRLGKKQLNMGTIGLLHSVRPKIKLISFPHQQSDPDLHSQQNSTLSMFIGSQVRPRPQTSYVRSIAKDTTTSKVSFHQFLSSQESD